MPRARIAAAVVTLVAASAAAPARASGATAIPPGDGPGGGLAGARSSGLVPPQALPARPGGAGDGSGTVLEEVSGTVQEVDRKAHRLVVDAGGDRVTLSLDRNTMVYTPAGLGTVLDVRPGAQIRAGRNAERLAYWVQVRGPAGAETPSTPGQGSGPAGGAGPPASEAAGPPGGAVPGAGTRGPGPGASGMPR